MALKQLQSLVQSVVANVRGNATGLESKVQGMRGYPAFLSYPRPSSPKHSKAEPSAWLAQGSALDYGTAQAVTRAGRPGCLAGLVRRIPAINTRGAIQSRWFRFAGTRS